MQKEEVLTRSKYIYSTGKLIHDRIYNVHSQYLASDERKKKMGELSLTQMNAILMVRNQGEVTMTELSNLLRVSPPSVSAMVDRLVEKKILIREHSTEDRRKVIVRVSPEAIPVIKGVEDAILGLFVELVEKVGSETARQWCEVLERVKAVLESTD